MTQRWKRFLLLAVLPLSSSVALLSSFSLVRRRAVCWLAWKTPLRRSSSLQRVKVWMARFCSDVAFAGCGCMCIFSCSRSFIIVLIFRVRCLCLMPSTLCDRRQERFALENRSVHPPVVHPAILLVCSCVICCADRRCSSGLLPMY